MLLTGSLRGKATTDDSIVGKLLLVITTPDPSSAPDVEIRSPLTGRLLHISILLVGTFVGAVVTIALAGRGTLWALLAGVALAVWIGYYYRLLNLAVIAHGSHLEVRNLFATHRIERSLVVDISLDESSVARSPNCTVVLTLAGGRRVALDACARTLQSGRKVRKVEEFHRRLEVWAEGPVELATV